MFYLRFDQVIVTWMLGDAANGQYAVAVRLVEVLFLVPLDGLGFVFSVPCRDAFDVASALLPAYGAAYAFHVLLRAGHPAAGPPLPDIS